MADFAAIAATGMSIERLLSAACLQTPVPVPGTTTKAHLIRTEDFSRDAGSVIAGGSALSIFLYRVDFNKTMRAAWSGVTANDGMPHLPLDLHFLLTPWSDNAEAEHSILGRAMQCLDSNPILSGPLLHESGNWATNESIQLIMDEISTEAVMRTFDSLPADYHISVPYIARVMRLDGRQATLAPSTSTVVTGKVPR